MPQAKSHTNIYIAAAQQDKPYLDRLMGHLRLLGELPGVTITAADGIQAGSNLWEAIEKCIDNAQIVLLLVSVDLVNMEHGLAQIRLAAQRHQSGKLRLIPVLLRDYSWRQLSLGDIRVLPANGISFVDGYWRDTSGVSEETPYVEVSRELLKLVQPPDGSAAGLAAGLVPHKSGQRPKRGKLLYLIPKQMELEKEYVCLVRIAVEDLPEEWFSQDLEDRKEELDTQKIRKVGKEMKVELRYDEAAFKVNFISRPVQAVEDDDYTEWEFEVTPLKTGRHELHLVVSNVRMDGDREVYKNMATPECEIEVVTQVSGRQGLAWRAGGETPPFEDGIFGREAMPQPKGGPETNAGGGKLPFPIPDFPDLPSVLGGGGKKSREVGELLGKVLEEAGSEIFEEVEDKGRKVLKTAARWSKYLVLLLFPMAAVFWMMQYQWTSKNSWHEGFDAMGELSNGRMAVMKDGRWGFLGEGGDMEVGMVYDSVGDFSPSGAAVVALNGKKGLIGKNGEVLAPIVLDEVPGSPGGSMEVSMGGERFTISGLGECLGNCPDDYKLLQSNAKSKGGLDSLEMILDPSEMPEILDTTANSAKMEHELKAVLMQRSINPYDNGLMVRQAELEKILVR